MLWIVAILLGGALAARSAYVLWRGWAARRWSVAEGEVVASTVRERRGRREPYVVPEVRYRYSIGTAEFTGRRLRFALVRPAFVTHMAAHAEIAGMEPGARVAVHYDPRSPGRAVLRPGHEAGDAVALVLGLALVVVGALLGTRG